MNLHFVLLDAVDTVRRRRYYLLVPFLVLSAVGAGMAFLIPPAYESSVTLLFRPGTEQLRSGTDAPGGAQARFTLLGEILQSRSTFVTLFDTLGWKAPEGEERDRMIYDLESSARGEERSEDMYRISVRDSDPGQAQHIAATLTEVVLAAVMRTELDHFDSTIAYLTRTIPTYGTGTPDTAGLPEEPAGDAQSLRISLARAEAELAAVETEHSALDKEVAELRSLGASLDNPETVTRLASLRGTTPAAQEVRTLARRYADLLSRYTLRYPEVQSLRRQLVSRLDRYRTAAERDAATLAGRLDQLRGRRTWLRARLAALPPGEEGPAGEPVRASTVTHRLHDDLSLQLEQVKIMRDLRAGSGNSLVVLERPSLPAHPVQPDRFVVTGAGMLAGILVGILALVIAESLDPTIRRQRDLRLFEKPVIAYFS